MPKRIKTFRDYKTVVQIFEIEEGKYVLFGVLNERQLKEIYGLFEPLARSWRGQFQALAKAIVSAYKGLGNIS
jgi:hypothetical protein